MVGNLDFQQLRQMVELLLLTRWQLVVLVEMETLAEALLVAMHQVAAVAQVQRVVD
jgi:hypothetical protein